PCPISTSIFYKLLGLLSGFGSWKCHSHIHERFTASFGKDHCHPKKWWLCVVSTVIVDETFVFIHFKISGFVRIVCAIRPVHCVVPMPTGFQILTMSRERKTPWPPPLCDLLRVGPRLPHCRYWSVVNSSNFQFIRFAIFG